MPSPPSPDSSPPPSEDDDKDDDEDRRRGLRQRLDLLNEDAQRARGRRIRNITHTITVTTVYEDGEGDLPCAAPPPERPAQVHHGHHAEDGAVAEHADGVDAREKDIKTASFLPPS